MNHIRVRRQCDQRVTARGGIALWCDYIHHSGTVAMTLSRWAFSWPLYVTKRLLLAASNVEAARKERSDRPDLNRGPLDPRLTALELLQDAIGRDKSQRRPIDTGPRRCYGVSSNHGTSWRTAGQPRHYIRSYFTNRVTKVLSYLRSIFAARLGAVLRNRLASCTTSGQQGEPSTGMHSRSLNVHPLPLPMRGPRSGFLFFSLRNSSRLKMLCRVGRVAHASSTEELC